MENLNHTWAAPPKDMILEDNEIHVWRAQLDLRLSQMGRLSSILTDDELDKANRFSFEIDRKRFIAARGILRSILSRYTTICPSHLRFYYNRYGKPFLVPDSSPYLLNFNLSHSGSAALYAITRKMEIGVDIERVCSNFEYEEIVKHFFSDRDASFLDRLPNEKKLQAFYKCWTRKEAYIKAYGTGLSLALVSFDVSFAPWESSMLLTSKAEPQECSQWTLLDLKPALGYMGALAVKGIGYRFRYWEWNQL